MTHSSNSASPPSPPVPTAPASPPIAAGKAEVSTGGLEYRLCSPGLPLAVYREVVAHLQQIPGVDVELLRQQSPEFDYTQSQVAGMRIRHADQATCYAQVERVLAYYGDRFTPWETLRT